MAKTLDESNVFEEVSEKFPDLKNLIYEALKEGEKNEENVDVIYGRVLQILKTSRSDKTIERATVQTWIAM